MNVKIYRVTSANTDKVYIGSTTQRLGARLASHKRGYKINKACRVNEIIAAGDNSISLIAEHVCNNEFEKKRYEYDAIVNEPNAVNKNKPQVLININYKDNKAEYMRKWNEYNKEYVKQQKSQLVNCSCGASIIKANKTRHEKTKKHLEKCI
jgi:hypothetical protein